MQHIHQQSAAAQTVSSSASRVKSLIQGNIEFKEEEEVCEIISGGQILLEVQSEEISAESDGAYNPSDDEEQGVKDDEEDESVNDEADGGQKEQNELEEDEEEDQAMMVEEDESAIVNSASFELELLAAIENVQKIAKYDQQTILSLARAAFEESTGTQATDEMVSDAFQIFVAGQIEEESVEEEEESESVEESEEEEEEEEESYDDEEEEEEEEEESEEESVDEYMSMSADESEGAEVEVDPVSFSQEMGEALENIRILGASHQEAFVNKISDTFSELNGAEPTSQEIAAIFGRIKAKFANEARADFLEVNDGDNDAEDGDYEPNEEDVQQYEQDALESDADTDADADSDSDEEEEEEEEEEESNDEEEESEDEEYSPDKDEFDYSRDAEDDLTENDDDDE